MALSVRSAGRARRLLVAPLVAALAATATALMACAAPASTGAAPVRGFDVRVLVKLTHPSEDSAAIAAEATREAGVPVGYAASVSAVWHALSLHCPDAATCKAAIDRLRRSGFYAVVEPDTRKQRAVM